MPNYWLIKSEPGAYSIDDLRKDGTTCWDGVRNFQARNTMRDGMRVGDRLLFYHSNAAPSAVVGLAEVARDAYPDHTAWEPGGAHRDPKSSPDSPIWLMVDVGYVATFDTAVTLAAVKEDAELVGMELARKGSRLSVQPVSEAHFKRICVLAGY